MCFCSKSQVNCKSGLSISGWLWACTIKMINMCLYHPIHSLDTLLLCSWTPFGFQNWLRFSTKCWNHSSDNLAYFDMIGWHSWFNLPYYHITKSLDWIKIWWLKPRNWFEIIWALWPSRSSRLWCLLHKGMDMVSKYSSRCCIKNWDTSDQATFSSLLLSNLCEPMWRAACVSAAVACLLQG